MFQAAFDKVKEKTNQQNQYPSYSNIQQRDADQSEENRATGLIKKAGQAGAAAGRMMNPTHGGGSAAGATYTVNAGNQPYVAQLNALYDQIMDRKPFQYDLNSDLLYKQMADQYMQMGKIAMRDATGTAAGLTGGYGNSYANQVGNQEYQQYMTALNQGIPDLYDRAYQQYLNEGNEMLQQYELAAAHPGMVDAIKPQTYTVSKQTDGTGTDGMQTWLQYLQNALSQPAQNKLYQYNYTLDEKKK